MTRDPTATVHLYQGGPTVGMQHERIQDGKIVSYHTYYDQLGLLTQLGLMGGS